MATLIIENMDDALMRDLASLAAENSMQVGSQAKQLLRRALPVTDRSALVARLDAIAALTPATDEPINSLDLLREDRQR